LGGGRFLVQALYNKFFRFHTLKWSGADREATSFNVFLKSDILFWGLTN
jgi:hypothetical protein